MAKIQTNTKNQLTDVAVNKAFNGDQFYRECQLKKLTSDFLIKFSIFVGFYNRQNKTSLSVEDALLTEHMFDLYMTMAKFVKQDSPDNDATAIRDVSQPKSKTSKKKASTKRLSYEQFQVENGSSVAHAIYKYLKGQKKPMSRVEIARGMNIRLSTVCGQIHAMAEAGLVYVVGTQIDPDSNREVEALFWR